MEQDRLIDRPDVEDGKTELETYMDLRRQVLGLRRSDYEAYMREHGVHAVLIDTNMDGIVYSVVMVVDGTISLYYQTGGGVLGMGRKFPDLAMKTRAFVYSCDQMISKLHTAENTSIPDVDQRVFYLVTADKVYKAVSQKTKMAEEPYEIQMLNYLSEKVMTQFISLYEAKNVQEDTTN